jgi:hypothetical protein
MYSNHLIRIREKLTMLHACRRHAGETDASRVTRLLQEARDVAFHLDSVRTHKVNYTTNIR